MLNTLQFLLVHIPLQVVLALALAYFLSEKIILRSFFRASFFLPVVISGVVVTILWQQLYGLETGLLNRALTAVGLNRVEWLSNPFIAMISIAIMATWKNVGLYVILFLVGLQTVPRSYYEAAEVEGASAWQQFRYITLPAINPTIFMVLILSTIGGFSLFIEPYIMTDGGPLNSTLSAMLYIYKQAFGYYQMGYSATLGLFFAMLIMGVVAVQKLTIEKKTDMKASKIIMYVLLIGATAVPLAEQHPDLRQARHAEVGSGRLTLAGECSMSTHVSLQQRVTDYLAERHRLGFVLHSRGTLLAGFARYAADRKHRGPLTADLMIEWPGRTNGNVARHRLGLPGLPSFAILRAT